MNAMIRMGIGYDVHRLVAGRRLILGGVDIMHDKGLLGHSDADVLLHAIMDALLGAAALGDLGHFFPDTDPQYEGISSLKLLAQVGDVLNARGYRVHNLDATVITQAPRLMPHIPHMRVNIAEALRLDVDRVSVKATTEEGLGFTGSGEGVSAMAIATIEG